MGFFAIFGQRLARRSSAQRLQAAALSPRRLERRRVLDAGAAELLLGSLADAGDYVQVGENLAAQSNETNAVTAAALSDVQVIPSSSSVSENGQIQLRAFFDASNDPATVATIDWGDGSTPEMIALGANSSVLNSSHQYLDDNPTATSTDDHTITVTITVGGNDVAYGDASVTVVNVAPSNLVLVPNRAAIFENQTAELTLRFVDIGSLDTHRVQVDWGDGSAIEQFDEASSVSPLKLSHQYFDDDPTATLSDIYRVRVTVTDDDGGQSVATTPVFVLNVQPTLTVADNQVVDEGALLDLTGGGLGSFTDVGKFDTHTATVNWGDGTPTETVFINQSNGSGTLDGSHRYADNGEYTVTVVLSDDDFGLAISKFDVEVNNVDPTLAGIVPTPTIDEGSAFTLTDLGVRLTDPGFDNPLNPLQAGGSEETFKSLSVDWGDGTPADMLNVVNRVNGSPGVATAAAFEHAPHTYADDGLYTVTIKVGDDDGGLVLRTFQIRVHNVAPTLELTNRDLEISEGETLDLFDLGTFSDPGFNNPLNTSDPSNGGELTETFSYTIDWGDGTVETSELPATVVNGSMGIDTLGTLADSHQYLDNDADNLFTITVTLSDDDGGSVTEQIIVRVLNVNPSLEPIVSATDVNTRGETVLTIEFADPGTEELTVLIDWGDRLALPPDQRFVSETFVPGPGSQNLTLMHTYAGPPNPASPASDIIISVFIRDDDFGDPVVGLGQSETQTVAISNPGTGVTPIVIDTTPQVPRLVFPQQDESTFFVGTTSSDEGDSQTADLRTTVGDTKSTTDRYLELRVIDPAAGEQSEGYRLKPEVLDDLPGLFRTLPDNRYAIYLVRTETNTRRLVIEVYVRNGKLIDPGDDSEGTRDRPPTDEATQEIVPTATPDLQNQPAEVPVLNPEQLELENPFPSDDSDDLNQRTTMLLGTTLVGFVASKSGRNWAERINRAIATADSQKWHRLRRRLTNNQNKPHDRNKR